MPLTGTRLPHPSPTFVRRDPPRTGGALVVVGGDEAPDWVAPWCARTGRDLRRQLVPSAGPDRVRAIGLLAAAAARADGAVLVLPESGRARPGPPRVVAAVRDLPDDAQAVAGAATSATQMDAGLVVAHGVPMSFGERSVGMDAALARARHLLDAAVDEAALAAPGVAVEPWLARVRPHELVGEGLDADLLVLGGPRADGPDRLGLVACSALHHAPCAVLIVPRPVR